jgi:RNA polymerase sigma-70 factor (ECF subfamily)
MANRSPLEEEIRRVREGDPAAFEAIVRAHEWPVRTWVAAHAPPGIDPDEIAQRTFVEVFRHIGQYRAGSDFRAWVITIARYQLLGETTRLRRQADYHRRYIPESLARELERRAEAARPEECDRLDRLRGCLEKLAAPAREVLAWRYSESLPLGEISRRTGRSVGALKKHLFLLRAKLHECVERNGILPEGSP